MYACCVYCLYFLSNVICILEFCITSQSIAKSDMFDALESLYILQSREWQKWDHRSFFPREVSKGLMLWLFHINMFLNIYVTSLAVEISLLFTCLSNVQIDCLVCLQVSLLVLIFFIFP